VQDVLKPSDQGKCSNPDCGFDILIGDHYYSPISANSRVRNVKICSKTCLEHLERIMKWPKVKSFLLKVISF